MYMNLSERNLLVKSFLDEFCHIYVSFIVSPLVNQIQFFRFGNGQDFCGEIALRNAEFRDN